MRLYNIEKINNILQQAKGNAMSFVFEHEENKIDKLKAKFYMDNLIVEVNKILEAREKEQR